MTRVLTLLLLSCLLAGPAHAAERQDFSKWLENYGAYDTLERELAGRDTSPETVLARAEALLSAGDPQTALDLLDKTPPFAVPEREARRLWLMGRALRTQGHLPEAVFRFSQAQAAAGGQMLKTLIQAEPNLDSIWKDVWRQWFWHYLAGPTETASQALGSLLERTAAQGAAFFADDFWKTAPAALAAARGQSGAVILPLPAGLMDMNVSESDRLRVAKGLAALSLGQSGQATSALGGLSDRTTMTFWSGLLDLIQTGRSLQDPDVFLSRGLVKPAAFFQGYWQSLALGDKSLWLLVDPKVPSWAGFKASLLSKPPREAVSIISRELESALIAPETGHALRQLALALALLDGDLFKAQGFFGDLEPRDLPLSLKAAAICVFDTPLSRLPKSATAGNEAALLATLAGAAGARPLPAVFAPFWVSADDAKLQALMAARPLDPALIYSYFHTAWRTAPTAAVARRLGFLFPAAPEGTQALLFLAQEAGRNGAYPLASFYLEQIDPSGLAGEALADYLLNRGSLEIELGREKEALKTYRQLYDLDSKRLPSLKKLKLALLAQQQGDVAWAQQVFAEIWQDRASLTPDVQAELLFWMAEGSHALGREDEALDTYLRIAWQYPDQAMWSQTAMYRAALIYELKGRFDAASKLYTTVAKNAGTKEQREAAQERLEAMQGKLQNREKQGKDAGNWEYPF